MSKTKVDKETGEITPPQPPYIRRPHHRERTRTLITGDSMTHQSHADSCDINNIIRKFDNTGVLPPAKHEKQYADVTALQVDLTEAYNDSIDKIAETDKFFKTREEDQKQKQKQKQIDLETEIETLKKKRSTSPDPDPGSSPA